MRNTLLLILAVTLLLSGCSETEEEVVEEPYIPVSERGEDFTLGDAVINSSTPFTGYNQQDDKVLIYPYYDLDYYITAQKIMISNQDWWKTVTEGTDVIHRDGYDILQYSSGISYGYMQMDDTTALFFRTDCLPLGYLDLYMSDIWLPDT